MLMRRSGRALAQAISTSHGLIQLPAVPLPRTPPAGPCGRDATAAKKSPAATAHNKRGRLPFGWSSP